MRKNENFSFFLNYIEILSQQPKHLPMRDFERDIWATCTEGRTIPWLRQELAEKAPNDRLKKEALNLVDEELLKLI